MKQAIAPKTISIRHQAFQPISHTDIYWLSSKGSIIITVP